MALLEENIEEKLHDIGLGNDFLPMTRKILIARKKIDKWDYIKLKTYVQQRKQLIKKQPIDWEKFICQLRV
jgi:hypothetical protein